MSRRAFTLSLVILYLLLLLAGAAYIYYSRPTGGASGGPVAGPEERTADHFNSIRGEPGELMAFLRQMPKGGDLHSHLSGAVYAESLIDSAGRAKLCIDRQTMVASGQCKPYGQKFKAEALTQGDMKKEDIPFYRRVVDAWSMRNWEQSGVSGHDQFFDTFGKFGDAGQAGEMLAEVRERAADGHVSYLELMLTPDGGVAKRFAEKLNWNDNFGNMRQALLDAGLRDQAAAAVRKTLDEAEGKANELLGCSPSGGPPGCGVTVRYLFQVKRAGPKARVFTEMVTAFEAARLESRLVGLNLVEPEDYPVPLRDFELHMKMLAALRKVEDYQGMHVALHAGELAFGLVPPEHLRSHIRQSVELAGANRIGHGVDVMYEDDPDGLLRKMVQDGVMVEICLTSNDVILGVRGKDHPLATYIKYGVPVALATDDEGVARSDMTNEYLKATREQGLDYRQLKRMARTSLEHAFIAGASLWASTRPNFVRAPACSADRPEGDTLSDGCRQFLEANDRAKLQWSLERDMAAFERKYL